MVTYKVYHGEKEGSENSGAASSGLGEWFGTDNKKYAERYGNVYQYKIELDNPYHMNFKEFRDYDRGFSASIGESKKYREELEKKGHDGIMVTHNDGTTEYILFNKRSHRIT